MWGGKNADQGYLLTTKSNSSSDARLIIDKPDGTTVTLDFLQNKDTDIDGIFHVNYGSRGYGWYVYGINGNTLLVSYKNYKYVNGEGVLIAYNANASFPVAFTEK